MELPSFLDESRLDESRSVGSWPNFIFGNIIRVPVVGVFEPYAALLLEV
jgi:hypothetical protein